ncbi:hypothetical protein [Candidatus Williamhamiltonella defendens]|uniref:hypothetical protein n=1 Tax=Candidatus Williamhamiltonella defendens TaxID=138072 RepID=UPI00130E36BA|nr:hypothetical protein [Candidatus Hamiltonella defensa]
MTDPNLQKNKTSIRLALSQNYVDQNWLKNQFSNASISRYASVYDATSSVAFGDNDYFLSNLASVNFLLKGVNTVLKSIYTMQCQSIFCQWSQDLITDIVNSLYD